MFFYIGKSCDLLNKQNDYLFTDLGWKKYEDIFYKGYCLEYDLEKNLDKIINGDKPQGIYCLIKDNKLYHPEIRPFPLYKKESEITNLKLDSFNELEKNRYTFEIQHKPLDTVIKNIINIIAENLSKFELNIVASGGIDSMMLVAIAEYAKIPYKMIIAKPRTTFIDLKDWEGTVQEYDSEFIQFCRNNYWAYRFISNYKEEKVLTVGFYGDEYFCRTIWQTNILTKGFNKHISQHIKPSDYLFKHINKSEYRYLHHDNFEVNFKDIKKFTLGTVGSPTAWHFDNTLIFCPLMDRRIAENIWALDENILFESAPNALIQREIIEQTHADTLLLIDRYKNDGYTRKNFFKNIEKVKLSSCTEIVVH